MNSCSKEADKKAIQEPISIKYNGKSYPTIQTLNKNGEFTTEFMPDELQNFYTKSEKETTVSHLVELGKNKEILFLYDSEEDFRKNVKFADGNKNQLKGYNGARVTTYSGGVSAPIYNNFPNIAFYIDYVAGSILRQTTNLLWKTYHFNSNWGYGRSIDWVDWTENDNIESIRFERFDSEWNQFMGCKHITWGGSKLWITNRTSNCYEINLNRIGWGNCISSYEYFQANVAIHGYNF